MWTHYIGGFLLVVATTGFNWIWKSELSHVNAALLYQVPVTLSAFWWGRWPSYFTAICSVAAFNFFFVSPIFTFSVDDLRDYWIFVTILLVAFVIGGQTELLRAETETARQRERTTRALYDFSKDVAAVIDLHRITEKLVSRAGETTGRRFLVLLPDSAGKLTTWARYDPLSASKEEDLSPAEQQVGQWAFEHGKRAGRTTGVSADADYLHISLRTPDSIVGVLCVDLSGYETVPEEQRIYEAWANLAAVAVERAQLTEKARQAETLVASNRLRNALFNSMSHDLRTPLASIIGSSSTLLESEELYTPAARRELLETIQDGAVRMERVVTNLLDTARLESGMMQLKYDWCDFEDVIGVVLHQLRDISKHHKIETSIEPELPLLWADSVLVEQVLVNLLDNAMKYSGYGKGIRVEARRDEENVRVSVLDEGCGIPATEQSRVFDKFYRLQQSVRIVGTGLGLSICKAIIQAHGGRIWVQNREVRGAAFHFTLPTKANDGMKKEAGVSNVE